MTNSGKRYVEALSMYAVLFSLRTCSLDARSRGGNVEIPDMKTAYAGH
jgi:hypothetical protein